VYRYAAGGMGSGGEEIRHLPHPTPLLDSWRKAKVRERRKITEWNLVLRTVEAALYIFWVFSQKELGTCKFSYEPFIIIIKTKLNSMVRVRERTIPTERPPLVGEVIANFCG
jgi:hypothetical protein